MENVEVLLDIRKGDIFKCYEDAEQKITENAKENFVQFYKRESRTITGGAKKTKRYLNPELRFYQVEWACVHGGRNFKCRGNGLRKSSTLRYEDPCPAHIRMTVSQKGDDFVIASVHNNHNHVVSESHFKQLPHQRKLPPEMKKEAKKLLDLRVSKHLLREEMERKYKRKITMKDLANINCKERVRKKNPSPQTKHKLLSTKLQKAASLGVEASGENFDKVSSLFDDIIEMLQNRIYKFKFTYEKNDEPIDNDNNGNIDINIQEDNIDYYIANEDTSDNCHVYSNINVVNIETVETETFNQDDNNAIMVVNSTDFDDTVFNGHINTSESNNFENGYGMNETSNKDVIVIDSCIENTDFDATDDKMNTISEDNNFESDVEEIQTFDDADDAIMVDSSPENTDLSETVQCPDADNDNVEQIQNSPCDSFKTQLQYNSL